MNSNNFVFGSIAFGGLLIGGLSLPANSHETGAPHYKDLNLTPPTAEIQGEEEQVEIKVPRAKLKKVNVSKPTTSIFQINNKLQTNVKTTCRFKDYTAENWMVNGKFFLPYVATSQGRGIYLPGVKYMPVVPNSCKSVTFNNGRAYFEN